jgi:uncharacterized membrane protein
MAASTATAEEVAYQPGVCNIAHDEVGYRRKSAFVGVIVTAVIAVILFAIGAPWWTQLFLFIPAALAAIGFLQARESFCVRYASQGKYNVEPGYEHTAEVAGDDAHAADMAKARSMNIRALLIGIAAAVVLAAIAAALS